MSTVINTSSRPTAIAAETSIGSSISDAFAHVGEFVEEIGYVASLVGQSFRAYRQSPEMFGVAPAVVVGSWLVLPGDLTSI